jgi:DNA-binding beta-propeller fold protein YncE
VALDSAHDLLFIPAFGNGGFRAFQLDERGLPVDRQARFITSRESIYGRRSVPPTTAEEATFPGAGAIIDTSTERFFTVDRFANRILVYDGNPSRLENLPSAEVVIGQPDFTSTRRGLGPNRLGAISGTQLDEENQRLFVSDGPNNRVLVFDVDPDQLTNDPRAVAVIGQDDLESRGPGIGPSKFNGPGSIAYDPVQERLFVSDSGNNRVLIFDVNPDNPDGLNAAMAVMGQPDFESRAPRESLDELRPAALSYDSRHQRLFMAEGLEHRIMVYDAHPDRVGGPARAIAVIGQPDAFSTHPAVSDRRVAMPRIAIDSEKEKLYISEGYPAGNRVTVWDISPDNLETGMSALDVIGHETLDGAPDFFNRMAQGHLDGRSLAAARAVTLDPVDHRLFVPDEYNHRVVVWQLDDLNRIADRDARWVLGQPDLHTSLMGEPTARNMTTPIGAAYDTSTKRLFVGDGYHNRILVYDAAPGQLENGMPASVVIGQRDFQSVERAAGPAGINFGVRMGRGIASDFLPMGFAIDENGQRLFVSDGENNRVLIYDVRRDVLRNGAEAIGILGQRNFQSTAPDRKSVV